LNINKKIFNKEARFAEVKENANVRLQEKARWKDISKLKKESKRRF